MLLMQTLCMASGISCIGTPCVLGTLRSHPFGTPTSQNQHLCASHSEDGAAAEFTMEGCDRPQEKECRLCGCSKPLDAFRRRSSSGSLRSECAACQNQGNADRNKRARSAEVGLFISGCPVRTGQPYPHFYARAHPRVSLWQAAVHGSETGPRSSSKTTKDGCSWQVRRSACETSARPFSALLV